MDLNATSRAPQRHLNAPEGQHNAPEGQHGRTAAPRPWLDLAHAHDGLRLAAWQHLALVLPYLLAGTAVGWCWYDGPSTLVDVHSATSGAIVGAATALALWMLRMPRVACVLVLLVGVLAVI